jgi:predicted DsbA family dithiol-disulfide isomerase
MQIDVISDTICPWCFIGKRRLQRAMDIRPSIVFDVKWRPYQLDTTVPPEIRRRSQKDRRDVQADRRRG